MADFTQPMAPAGGSGGSTMSITGMGSNMDHGTLDEPVIGQATLTCSSGSSSATGYLQPMADSACGRAGDDFVRAILLAPRSPDLACAGVFGGPDVAHFRGTIDGASVDRRIDRSDGCGIDEWDTLTLLLPAAGGAITFDPDG